MVLFHNGLPFVSTSFVFDGVVHVDERELAGRKPLKRFCVLLGDNVPLFSSVDSPLTRLQKRNTVNHFDFETKGLLKSI